MAILSDVAKRLPSPNSEYKKSDTWPRRAEKNQPLSDFFGQRIRLKSGSNASVPLGIVLLFPFLVVVLILLLFVRSPGSESVNTMPGGGTPPSIR